MKKFIYTFALLIATASFGFSQDMYAEATSQGSALLEKSKATGEYEFTLPQEVTKERVEKSASYYTSHFTVTFNEETKKAKIKMVNNSQKSRFVIVRFLGANGAKTIKVDDESLKPSDFIEKYLN